jgi:hypothetical protein
VTVRIHYDHRVMDGANVARALEKFEKILNGEVADEVAQLVRSAAVPVAPTDFPPLIDGQAQQRPAAG